MVDDSNGVLTLNQLGVAFGNNLSLTQNFELEISTNEKWILKEDIELKPELHIVM